MSSTMAWLVKSERLAQKPFLVYDCLTLTKISVYPILVNKVNTCFSVCTRKREKLIYTTQIQLIFKSIHKLLAIYVFYMNKGKRPLLSKLHWNLQMKPSNHSKELCREVFIPLKENTVFYVLSSLKCYLFFLYGSAAAVAELFNQSITFYL